MISVFQSVEGAQSADIRVPNEIQMGQFVRHFGRGGVVAFSAKPGERAKVMKRATVSCASNMFPFIPVGMLGPLYGTFIAMNGDLELYRPDINGDTILGIVEAWEGLDLAVPRFIVSLGDSADGSSIDQTARDRADEAYYLAENAFNKFPPFGALATDDHEAPFDIPAGGEVILSFDPTFSGIQFDGADRSKFTAPSGGFYYVVVSGLRPLTANGDQLRVSIESDQENASVPGEKILAESAGGQVETLMRFSATAVADGDWRQVRLTNLDPDNVLRLDDAGLSITLIQIAK